MELKGDASSMLLKVIDPATANSNKSPENRRSLPFRSLENTDFQFLSTEHKKSQGMVCSESTDDGGKVTVVSENSEQCTESITATVVPNPAFREEESHHLSATFSPKMVRSARSHRGAAFSSQDAKSVLPNNGVHNSKKAWIKNDSFADHYIVEEQIGRGKFAVVKRCQHILSGRKYAAKFLRKRRKGKDCRAEILKEIKMLEMAITHPRLVDLIEVFETSHDLIIVTEYAEGGELFQRVMEEESFEEHEVKRLLRQILEAVLFLHERNIVHLDIKPQNVLLTSACKGNVKLCDLGFARPINSDDDVRDILGTPDYVAPEILSYEPIHTSSDMWSIGVLTYVMLTGCSPFAGDTNQETFLNISQGNLDFPEELFGDVSSQATDFISKLLVVEPESRLSARECFHHPWLQRIPSDSPLGQRRALTPPSPDTITEEPVKKCRCQVTTPPPTKSQLTVFDGRFPCDPNEDILDPEVTRTLNFEGASDNQLPQDEVTADKNNSTLEKSVDSMEEVDNCSVAANVQVQCTEHVSSIVVKINGTSGESLT